MEFVTKKEDNKHLLILVHGLNGSRDTWIGNDQRFVEILNGKDLIQENFDIALFNYGTKIFKINWLTKIINLIKGFFKNRPKEDLKGFNVGIKSIADSLEFETRNTASKYQSISFISHSMGGLVTKKALTIMDSAVREKVRLFISLSVPHLGAYLANIGKLLLGNNPQIIDLQAMGEFTTELNEHYSNLPEKPRIIYQSGNQDTVVRRQAAIPPNVRREDTISTRDDHFSVVLIKDSNNNSLLDFILKEIDTAILPMIYGDAEVPEGTPFKFFIESFVSRIGARVDFIGFTETELNTKLRNGKISSPNFKDFLIKVGELAINKIPEYSIEKEYGTSNFTIKTEKI